MSESTSPQNFQGDKVFKNVSFSDIPLDATVDSSPMTPSPAGGVGSPSPSALVQQSSFQPSPSGEFNTTASSITSLGSQRRRVKVRSSAMIELAEQEAKEQFSAELRNEVGHNSSDDDDMKVEKKILDHKEVLQRATSRLHLNDAIRNREQSELHKTVDTLMRDVEHLREKLKDETTKKAAAMNGLHDAKVERTELEEQNDALETKVARQLLRIEELEAQNQELELQLVATPRSEIKITPMPKPKKASSSSSLKAGSSMKKVPSTSKMEKNQKVVQFQQDLAMQQQQQQQQAQEQVQAMQDRLTAVEHQQVELVTWAESEVRQAIESEAANIMVYIGMAQTEHQAAAALHSGGFSASLLQRQAHMEEVSMLFAMEGMRRNALLLDESYGASKLTGLRFELQEQLDYERSKEALRVHETQHGAVASPRSDLLHMSVNRHRQLVGQFNALRHVTPRRSTSQKSVEDQTGRPWYPSGSKESCNYHRKSPGRAGGATPGAPSSRSTTPRRPSQSPAVSRINASRSVSQSSHTPQHQVYQNRARTPSPSPSQSSAPQPTPRSSARHQDPAEHDAASAAFQNGAPPHLSRTVENMAALLDELQKWRMDS